MRFLRPFLSTLTLLLLFSNFCFSQNKSSIYQDAKNLGELIREKQVPVLDLTKIKINNYYTGSRFDLRNGTKKIETTKQDKFDETISIPSLSLSTVGTYNIKMGLQDTLQINIQDSLIQIKGGSPLHSIKISFEPDKTIISRLDSIAGNSTKFQPITLFESNGDFIKMLEILDAHTYLFPLRNIYDYSSIRKIPQAYSKNPFFTSDLKTELLLNKETTRVFLSDDYYYEKKRSLVNYDWHKLMYGDSSLQFDKTISLQDVSSNYRAPITSKNELEIANSQINKTSREKGFLDAKTIAVGLSDFIAERAQEELNLTFFNRFKENLKDSSELTILFPNTRDLLYKFEISNYKTLLSHARESFTVDLDNLGLNFPKVLELDKYKELNNSPEVFNLALIYSITDLAYRDVPVENIMFAGFKKLQQRKIELAKSIDAQLADRILFPKIEKKENEKSKNISPILPKIIKGQELNTLNTLTQSYLDAVKDYQNNFSKQVRELGRELGYHKEIDEIRFKIKTDSFKFEKFITHLETNLSNQLEEARPLLIDYDTRVLRYQNRKINDPIIDFYKKTISANLDQREYFEYMTFQPSIEEYNEVFERKPKSKKELVAQGITSTRNLINEHFDITLEEKFNKLKSTANEVRTLKRNLLQIEKTNESIVTKIDTLIAQADLLQAVINIEIKFWITALDSNLINYPHHNISALKYLATLLVNDYYIGTFRYFQERSRDISRDHENLNDLINENYSNTIGEDFQGSLNIAYGRLDSILLKFETKVNQLTKKFGNQKIPSKVLSGKNSAHQNYKEYLALTQRWNQSEDIYDSKIGSIGMKYWEIENNNSELNNLKNQSFALSDQQDEIFGLAQSEGRIMSAADSIKINQLDKEKENLTTKINEISKKLVIERLEEVNKIEDDFLAEKKQISERIDSLNNSFYSQLTSDVTNDSLSTIGQEYDFSKNNLLQIFHEKKARLNMMDSTHFQELDRFDYRLNKVSEDLENLKQSKKELHNYLLALENEYCKNLVDAKVNAQNLSKGLEFSIHLLLAFRDYKKTHQPITVSDTTRIVVTKNKIDSKKGFILGTATLDSLDIKNEPIKELNVDTTVARWISLEDFSKMRNDPIEWNLFLGLLYQRLSIIEDAPNFSASGTALLATKFFSITNDMEGYRQQLRIKKADPNQNISFRDYYPFIRSTVDLFNTVITTPSIGTQSLEQKYPSLASVPQISNEALSLYENIYVKEYGNAVLNAMQLLRLITKRKSTDSAMDKKEKKELRRSNRNINAVLTYGTFMADMVKAQTSNQVKNILKSATLPPGSSRIKRETVSSFTINSYLGAGLGNDHLLNVPDGLNLDKNALGASLFVPIGFTYSFSPNWWKPKGSFSVHVPLIDLGAITAFRQNPDNPNFNIDALPDFSWSNLFSPGAFIAYNVNNSPFTFGVGGIYGPQLRQIKFDTGEAVNVNSWRFPMGFITIDVPFFNLHTGARKIEIE